MARRLVVTAVLASAIAAAAAPPAHAATRPICGGPGATLSASSGARAYVRHELVWACAPGRHRAYRIGHVETCTNPGVCAGVAEVHVAGPYVAYGTFVCCGNRAPSVDDPEWFTLVVRDARTGAFRYRISLGEAGTYDAVLYRIALRADGAVGWTWGRDRFPEVWRSPGCGPQLVDQTNDIEPNSLRVTATGLTWRSASGPRHAKLCAP